MVEKKEFGMTDGYKVFLFTLKNSGGMTVKLTNYSGAIVGIEVPDKNGSFDDVVLGYDDLNGYVEGKSSQGALVGRYANRIANAEFTLGGKKIQLRPNENMNSLHGGIIGFSKRVWTVDGITDDISAPTERKTSPETLKLPAHIRSPRTTSSLLNTRDAAIRIR